MKIQRENLVTSADGNIQGKIWQEKKKKWITDEIIDMMKIRQQTILKSGTEM